MKKIVVLLLIIVPFMYGYSQVNTKATLQASPATAKNNADAADFYNSGNKKMILKDYQGSIADFTKAIELKPDFARAYLSRGIVKATRLHDYKGAIPDYNKSIEITPTIPGAYYYRASAKDAMKDYQGAIADYSKAIDLKIQPVSLEADAYHNMGLIKIMMGQKESGCSDLHKALALGNKASAEEIKKYCN